LFSELRAEGVLGSKIYGASPIDYKPGRVRKKGKPAARRGRKAHGPLEEEVAGLPERQGHGRARDQEEQEWEPSAPLMGALEEASLLPGATLDGDLAGLKPHLEEALVALGRLGRRRDLSEAEKMRAEALRMLLASIERAQQQAP
jgi:hypothetical protein